MNIDFHAHWTSPGFAALLEKKGVSWSHQHPETLDARLDALAAAGIDRQVLSLPGLANIDSLPVGQAAPLVRGFNESVSEAVETRPDRFAGLASLPHSDLDAALAELEHAHRNLGLRGAILPVDAFYDRATVDRLAPLFAAGEQFGSHFFIHPGAFHGAPVPALRLDAKGDAALRAGVELQTRITQAWITLTRTDFLEAYPSVTIQLANLGGVLPFLLERLEHQAARRGGEPVRPPLRRVYLDTASFGPEAIGLTARLIGSDRLVFGTDHPIFPLQPTRDGFAAARLSDAERKEILAGNGLDLFAAVPAAA